MKKVEKKNKEKLRIYMSSKKEQLNDFLKQIGDRNRIVCDKPPTA